MLRSAVTPLGRETGLGSEGAGTIVSETDLQGHITYVNEAFLRVSGFSEAELVGQPHSVTRHPAMPRAIFAQMWRKVRRGEEIFFYVQNRAKNGGDYWELAHVTPRVDAKGAVSGYRSVRRRADHDEVAQIEPFYRKIRKLEPDAERLPQRSTTARETGDAVAAAA